MEGESSDISEYNSSSSLDADLSYSLSRKRSHKEAENLVSKKNRPDKFCTSPRKHCSNLSPWKLRSSKSKMCLDSLSGTVRKNRTQSVVGQKSSGSSKMKKRYTRSSKMTLTDKQQISCDRKHSDVFYNSSADDDSTCETTKSKNALHDGKYSDLSYNGSTDDPTYDPTKGKNTSSYGGEHSDLSYDSSTDEDSTSDPTESKNTSSYGGKHSDLSYDSSTDDLTFEPTKRKNAKQVSKRNSPRKGISSSPRKASRRNSTRKGISSSPRKASKRNATKFENCSSVQSLNVSEHTSSSDSEASSYVSLRKKKKNHLMRVRQLSSSSSSRSSTENQPFIPKVNKFWGKTSDQINMPVSRQNMARTSSGKHSVSSERSFVKKAVTSGHRNMPVTRQNIARTSSSKRSVSSERSVVKKAVTSRHTQSNQSVTTITRSSNLCDRQLINDSEEDECSTYILCHKPTSVPLLKSSNQSNEQLFSRRSTVGNGSKKLQRKSNVNNLQSRRNVSTLIIRVPEMLHVFNFSPVVVIEDTIKSTTDGKIKNFNAKL